MEKDPSPLLAVLQVSLLFAQERNLDRLLQMVVEKALQIAQAERGCVALLEGQRLVPKATIGLHAEEGARISQTLAQEVLEKKVPLMWEDLRREEVGRATSILHQKLRSAMAAPLLIAGKILGVLYVDATRQANYTSADMVVFQALGAQAAMAIQNAQLFQEVVTDDLTGLYTAGIFYRRLDEEVDRHMRHGQPLSVLLVQPHGLPALITRYGYAAGEQALLALAGVLRTQLRSGDLPCRYGSDQFALIMPKTTSPTAAALCQQLARATEEIVAAQIPGWQGAMWSTATIPDDGNTATDLLGAAHSRLHDAVGGSA